MLEKERGQTQQSNWDQNTMSRDGDGHMWQDWVGESDVKVRAVSLKISIIHPSGDGEDVVR